MLDEHTQKDPPCHATKQTMTDRSGLPQSQEDSELKELYSVFKNLRMKVDKKILLEKLNLISESIPPCQLNPPPITKRKSRSKGFIKRQSDEEHPGDSTELDHNDLLSKSPRSRNY